MKPALYPRPLRGLGFWALTLALVGVLLLSGCSIPSGYVVADRMTYKGIGMDYLRYVNDDHLLTRDERLARRDLVLSWDARIKRAEAGEEKETDGE